MSNKSVKLRSENSIFYRKAIFSVSLFLHFSYEKSKQPRLVILSASPFRVFLKSICGKDSTRMLFL